MYKRILFILPLFLWLQTTLSAQDMVGCTQLLEDAREAYTAGMVELVPELLLPCIESGLSGEPKKAAYKLVINAYLFDYLPDEADQMMSDFLDENPSYEAQPSDPAEFKLLLDAHKQRREEEAAARVAAARVQQLEQQAAQQQAAEESKQQRKVKGSSPDNEKPRLGFVAGFTGSKGMLLESYSIGNPNTNGGKFSFSPGFLLGARMDLPVSKVIEIGIGLQYSRVNLKYSASPYDFTSYEYHEGQNRIQLPLSMAVYMNPKDLTRVYFRLGVVPDYLLSASAKGTRTYDESGTLLKDVDLASMPITEKRSSMNIQGLLGLGLSIPLQRAFLSVEAAYAIGFLQSNKGESRYDNQDDLWILYHVDSDFGVSQLLLSVGMTWNLN